MSVRTTEAAETEALGAELAAELGPGDVVLVAGDVGTGKSTLIRGALRALGVEGPIPSPTFTIGRRYVPGNVGPVPAEPPAGSVPARPVAFSHLDLYRLADLGIEEPGLLDDYLTADAVAFIEWPEIAAEALARDGVRVARRVEIRHAGGDRREIEVSAPVAPRGPQA
jgi:tRNA threonylcarbamoyladenosine biosynthesis protein TsaE